MPIIITLNGRPDFLRCSWGGDLATTWAWYSKCVFPCEVERRTRMNSDSSLNWRCLMSRMVSLPNSNPQSLCGGRKIVWYFKEVMLFTKTQKQKTLLRETNKITFDAKSLGVRLGTKLKYHLLQCVVTVLVLNYRRSNWAFTILSGLACV